MSRASELAKELFPDPKLEDYDDILVYRADRDNAIVGRAKAKIIYAEAEKDLALTAEDVSCIIHLANQFGKDYQKIADVFNKDREEENDTCRFNK